MNKAITDNSIQKATKIAGLAYFLIIFTSLLSMIFIDSKLTVEGDTVATIQNIIANPILFRINLVYELMMFAGVVILAWALYIILKTVNKNIALLAMLWRIGEAILGGLSVFLGFVVLLLIDSDTSAIAFNADQIRSLAGIFLDMRAAAMTIIIFFLCLGTILFCYLLFKSKYIPRWLSAWGIISFIIMLGFILIDPLWKTNLFMLFGTPAIFFELFVGIWLFFKGVKVGRPSIVKSVNG